MVPDVQFQQPFLPLLTAENRGSHFVALGSSCCFVHHLSHYCAPGLCQTRLMHCWWASRMVCCPQPGLLAQSGSQISLLGWCQRCFGFGSLCSWWSLVVYFYHSFGCLGFVGVGGSFDCGVFRDLVPVKSCDCCWRALRILRLLCFHHSSWSNSKSSKTFY